MKQNLSKTNQQGFTLIELLVVIAIIALLSTLVVVDFNRQRAVRSVVLAQNETITNMRKTQSYLLSGRKIDANTPAIYYIMNFRKAKNRLRLPYTSYLIRAVDKNYNVYPVETPSLPDNAMVNQLEVDTYKAGNGDDGAGTSVDCVTIAFGAPFGQIYISETCNDEILGILQDPVQKQAAANRDVRITLSNLLTPTKKAIMLFGVSGRIDPK
jgi:prepilin-type N-terminal cleavage/methylation domain-containing protein